MTDKQQIQEWLNRFMAGSATELEEQQLADYFCSATDVPEEWLPYAILFRQSSVRLRWFQLQTQS